MFIREIINNVIQRIIGIIGILVLLNIDLLNQLLVKLNLSRILSVIILPNCPLRTPPFFSFNRF
jgi:hypothetical protein